MVSEGKYAYIGLEERYTRVSLQEIASMDLEGLSLSTQMISQEHVS
jgi:hypothetical protein